MAESAQARKGPQDQESLRRALLEHWRAVYNFAYRNSLSPSDAAQITEATFQRAWAGRDQAPSGADLGLWLLKITAHVLEKREGTGQHVSFDLLDDTLRSEATRTDVVSSLTDPQRNYLLWNLKQGCMTAVLNCLPVSERVAFTLSVMNEMSDQEGARTLGINQGAYKVRLSRARKKITSYLAARCEHVDPRNPCHCPSRVGIALEKGFIAPPPSAEVRLRPFGRYGGGDEPERDVLQIYTSLPEPEAPEDLVQRLERALASGACDAKP